MPLAFYFKDLFSVCATTVSPHFYRQRFQSIGSHEDVWNIKMSAIAEDKKLLFYPFLFYKFGAPGFW
jgi:hypothetical protein